MLSDGDSSYEEYDSYQLLELRLTHCFLAHQVLF